MNAVVAPKRITPMGLAHPVEPANAIPTSTPDEHKPLRRAKLWDLEAKHHCPVIGTCLTPDELGKFAKHLSNDCNWRDEFALHVEVVGCARSRNAVSQAVQKHLERKFQFHIVRFERAKSDAEVLALWQEHFMRGEVAGPLWAATTHKAASNETRQRIYADVHMLSHQVGAGQAANSRRLTYLERENSETKAALEKQRKQHASSEARLTQQLKCAAAELDCLRAAHFEGAARQTRLAALESGSAMLDLRRELLRLQAANEEMMVSAQRSVALEISLQAAQVEAQALKRERDELIGERDALERLLLADEAPGFQEDHCSGQCAACEHATQFRSVLCVGGRSSLIVQYRALAQRLGMRLIHHDGGLEEALSRLPDMIKGADAVMCPTDCVSHNAYYQVKRQCKHSDKPCLLFKGAGLSGFALALAQLSSGRVTIG